jgi:hypothetical protein
MSSAVECATTIKMSLTVPGASSILPPAEVLFAYDSETPVGFTLFYHNYSTFLGQRGLFLEDLFVMPEARGKGIGYALLSALAEIAPAVHRLTIL